MAKHDTVFKIHGKEKQDMDFKTRGWFIKSFKFFEILFYEMHLQI